MGRLHKKSHVLLSAASGRLRKCGYSALVQGQETGSTKKCLSKSDLLGDALKLMALLTAGMYFYGYGVALAYERLFQIKARLFLSSPLDLVWLGIETLPMVLDHLFRADLLNITAQSGWIRDMGLFAIYGVGTALLWLLCVAGYRRGWGQKLKHLMLQALPHREALEQKRGSRVLMRSVSYGAVIFAFLNALKFAGVLLLLLFLAVGILPVALGEKIGMAYAYAQILEPQKCQSVRSQAQWLSAANKHALQNTPPQVKEANCLRVTYVQDRATKEVLGRYVVSTNDDLFLYDVAGRVLRVPIKSALIEPTTFSNHPIERMRPR